jgi:hypothetical protein
MLVLRLAHVSHTRQLSSDNRLHHLTSTACVAAIARIFFKRAFSVGTNSLTLPRLATRDRS